MGVPDYALPDYASPGLCVPDYAMPDYGLCAVVMKILVSGNELLQSR